MDTSQSGTTDATPEAVDRLLAPAGLDLGALEGAMGQLLQHKIDFGDLYFQQTRYEAWSLEDRRVKDGTYSIEQGVGVRALAGDKTGFAYSDQIDAAALTEAAQAARAIARHGEGRARIAARATTNLALYPAVDPLVSWPDDHKVRLLTRLDEAARAMDPRVKEVIANLAGVYETILIVASDGTCAADVRPLVRLNVSVIMESGERREQGFAGAGGRSDYRRFDDFETALTLAEEAVRQAAVNMEDRPAPAGNMPVVLGPGWPGVLLHEAIGHGLEGDFNRKGTSAFAGRIGEPVASTACTVVDDGTLPGRRGSLNV
jgi:TldD protein